MVLSLFPEETEIHALIAERLAGKTTEEGLTERLAMALKGMSLTEAEHLLRRLLADRAWARDVGEAGRRFAAEFTGERFVRAWRALVEEG